MAITIKISGNPVLYNERRSISVDRRIEERSTAAFSPVDITGAVSYVRGQPIEMRDVFGAIIFSGFIDTPNKKNQSRVIHDISCMDNHYLADKRLVVQSYRNVTAGFMVHDIWENYLADEGVTIGDIQNGPVVAEAIFNYVKVSECYDNLKELCGTFTWIIDDLKRLYFIDRSTNLAPWNLDGQVHRPIKDSVSLSTGNPLYRNYQYIWGGTATSDLQTSNFTGNGVLTDFALGYPLASEPVSIKENTVIKTLGIKGIDTGKDYYWSKGDNTVAAAVAPAIGVTIQVKYYGQFPLMTYAINGAGVAARKAIEGGTGIVEDIVREAFHETKESARQSASAKITQYCQEAESFTYKTYERGLAPGQLQSITYSPFGLVAHQMLIESVQVNPDGDLVEYTVTCITGPAMGSWSQFFSRILKRQDQSIRVGGDLLLKLLATAETLALVEFTALNTDNFSGGVVNRWLALPPGKSKGCNLEHEKLGLSESAALSSHATGAYLWDNVTTKWDMFTWA